MDNEAIRAALQEVQAALDAAIALLETEETPAPKAVGPSEVQQGGDLGGALGL